MPLDIYAVVPGSVIHYLGWNGRRTVTRYVLAITQLERDQLRVVCLRTVQDQTSDKRIQEAAFQQSDQSYELDTRYEHA